MRYFVSKNFFSLPVRLITNTWRKRLPAIVLQLQTRDEGKKG